MEGDPQSDGDEFEEYKPRARPLPSRNDDDQPSYMASVGPGYGSGHGAGDPDLGRSSYRSRFSSNDDSQTSSRLGYTSRFSRDTETGSNGTSGTSGTSGYRSRLSRSNTLSDFDFDRPSSKYSSMSSSSSGFTSRFLQKVRDKKTENPGEGPTEEAPKSTKPFKSRFLRASFDNSDFSSKSSSYVSRFKGTSDSSFSASKPSDTNGTSPPSDNSAPDAAVSDKTEE